MAQLMALRSHVIGREAEAICANARHGITV